MSKITDPQLNKWNLRHSEAEGEGEIAQILQRNLHLLPAEGTALDIACGRGANALLLAERGLQVTAWDFSPVAIERLRETASDRQLQINAEVRDVLARPPVVDSFDVILVSYFLDRDLIPYLYQALKHNGLILYQTFIRDAVSDGGPVNPEWRLADNELLNLFAGLRVHYYREDGRCGDINKGIRNIAMLAASKSASV